MSKKFYLAGPMSGIPQFNFPAFFEAGTKLRERGWDIISPAELDDAGDKGSALASPDGDPNNRDYIGGKTWGDYLKRDVKIVADQVQGIVLLPGWEESRGARLEAFCAVLCKDYEFYFYLGDGRVTALTRANVLDTIYAESV